MVALPLNEIMIVFVPLKVNTHVSHAGTLLSVIYPVAFAVNDPLDNTTLIVDPMLPSFNKLFS